MIPDKDYTQSRVIRCIKLANNTQNKTKKNVLCLILGGAYWGIQNCENLPKSSIKKCLRGKDQDGERVECGVHLLPTDTSKIYTCGTTLFGTSTKH